MIGRLEQRCGQLEQRCGQLEQQNDLMDQRLRRLETAQVVTAGPLAEATATVCEASSSSAEPTLVTQLLQMGFNHKDVLAIPHGVTGVEDAANYLFSK